MRRTLFYEKLTVEGTEELDFLHNPLSKFSMEYEPKYYRVDDSDIPDPWLISYRCYGVIDFWWILLVVNEIQNPFTELIPGLILTVPNVMDIYKFQRKYRVRRS
jgi:hypothetical protein